jgi:uncharacterized protein YbjT (DUF2867 family)
MSQEDGAMFAVAGASGRTGRVVAESLLAQGRKVRVIVRDAARGEAFKTRGAEVAVASLDDAPNLARALEGAAGVYTLLPEDLEAPDFHGHRRRMADAMAAAVRVSQVPHVVFLSAPPAMLPDGNGPAKDLHYAEQALRDAVPGTVILRASYFQENVLAAAGPAKQEGIYPNFLPSADFAFPTVATRDIGGLAARLLSGPAPRGEIIDLAGPAYSVREMAERLGQALGRRLQVVDIPAAAHVEAFMKAGLPRPFAEALAEMFACFASGRVVPQGARLERGTTTLEEVLRDGLAEGTSGGRA